MMENVLSESDYCRTGTLLLQGISSHGLTSEGGTDGLTGITVLQLLC